MTAREGADPLRDRRRVADGHDDVFDAAADLIGDDLRQRRARALPLRRRAGRDRDLGVGQDADGPALERPEPRPFYVVRESDATMPPSAPGLPLPPPELLIIGAPDAPLLPFGKSP